MPAEDVAFHDLALTILDEERKFGRERTVCLRAPCPGCHVLSMTATPIPRPPAAAEIGLVDVSVPATAPRARRPVETRALLPPSGALRDAVAQEVARGGQRCVVCPRIDGPVRIGRMLGAEGRDHLVAHGQMPEDDLEARLMRFMDGEVDAPPSTSIAEGRLDDPRAYTVVVFDAELWGPTRLHQLRGRVGRGDVRARMPLLSDGEPDGEDDAARRLIAFTEASEIGCGFGIARRDRDMHGLGELDGDERSGHMSRLGLGLYRHVLRGRRPRGPDEAPKIDGAA